MERLVTKKCHFASETEARLETNRVRNLSEGILEAIRIRTAWSDQVLATFFRKRAKYE